MKSKRSHISIENGQSINGLLYEHKKPKKSVKMVSLLNIKKVSFIFLLLFISHFLYCQKASILDSVFASLYNEGKFNGNVLVAENGNIIFEKSYGLANEKTKEELNPESVFELASVSKQFTALAIVLLQKQGKLQYDDKISKYIPELSFYENVTIRNLLNHTGGLPDYMELLDKTWDRMKIATNQDIINQFAKHKPAALFLPNEKWIYSNTGYALLATIIERVSKETYEKFLQTNVFKPLEMNTTYVYQKRYKPRQISNYALGYESDSAGNKILPDDLGKGHYTYFLDGIVGDGTVNSTLKDLLKWDRALYTNKLINNADRNMIFSSAKTKDGKETNYGFGWMLTPHEKYGKIVNHSGGWAGYLTFIERHIDNDKTVIMLQNNMTGKNTIPINDVRKILYNEKLETETLKRITLSTVDLDKYLGVYAASELPIKFVFSKKGNLLYFQPTNQPEYQLEAYENHVFKFDPAEIKIIFNPEKNTLDFSQGQQVHLTFTRQ